MLEGALKSLDLGVYPTTGADLDAARNDMIRPAGSIEAYQRGELGISDGTGQRHRDHLLEYSGT